MTHNPTHPAGGAEAAKALALSEVPAEVVVAMGAYLNLNYPEAGLDDDDLAAMFREGYNALSPTPVPEPTAADMRAFGASAVAAYKWPGDTPEHRAARAAYCEGAASVVPEPEAEGEERGWLIELKGNVPSWAIVNPHDYDEHWTTDSTKALRFARKTDAQAYIDHIGWSEAFPSEHIWDDGKARPPSEAEGEAVAGLREQAEAVKYAWEVIQGQCSDGDGFTERAAHDLDDAINALDSAPSSEAQIADLRAKLAAATKLADGYGIVVAMISAGAGDPQKFAKRMLAEYASEAEAVRNFK